MEVGTRFQKIHAINKAKKYQLLANFFLYSTAVLTCLFFANIFWFTPSGLNSTSRLFVFGGFLPSITSVFLSYISVFIFGNLIVIVLIGESKFFAPNHPTTSDVYYNEYINQKRGFQTPSNTLEVKQMFESLVERRGDIGQSIEGKKWWQAKHDSEREDGPSLSTEELNRRADDFIKRVNKQRRLEARLLVYYTN